MARLASGDEVFHDDVDNVLVEDLHVSETVYVERQALQLDATLVGNVFDADGGEVGEIRERTNRGELRDLEIYLDLAAGKLVGKRVERKQIHLRARRRFNVEALLVWCW